MRDLIDFIVESELVEFFEKVKIFKEHSKRKDSSKYILKFFTGEQREEEKKLVEEIKSELGKIRSEIYFNDYAGTVEARLNKLVRAVQENPAHELQISSDDLRNYPKIESVPCQPKNKNIKKILRPGLFSEADLQVMLRKYGALSFEDSVIGETLRVDHVDNIKLLEPRGLAR